MKQRQKNVRQNRQNQNHRTAIRRQARWRDPATGRSCRPVSLRCRLGRRCQTSIQMVLLISTAECSFDREVEHNAGSLAAMNAQIKEALTDIGSRIQSRQWRDPRLSETSSSVASQSGHGYANGSSVCLKSIRRALHPNEKTDDNDLEAIFHAAINGYGLAILPVDENDQSLQRLTRHRGILVKQRAKLQAQIRTMMHQCMRGYHDLFIQHKFFKGSVAMPLAKKFSSTAEIKQANVDGLAKHLKQ